MPYTPQLGSVHKQSHVHARPPPALACRERRDSTRSEVIVAELGRGSPRPRSATTTAHSPVTTNRWLDGLSTAHSESMCELQSLVTVLKEKAQDEPEVVDRVKDSGKRKGRSLAARFRRWKAEAEPREAWLLLFFAIIPVNMLIGVEYITFGIYYVEYVDYFEVASATAGFMFTIRAAFISVFSVVTSSMIRKFSARSICVCGGIVIFISQVSNSLAPNVYVLYLTNGVIIAIGNNLTFMVTNFLIQKHFSANRGFGGSCSTIGYSIGHLTGPIVVTYLIQKYGWRGSTLIMSGVMAHIIVFGAFYREPANARTKRPEIVLGEEGRDPVSRRETARRGVVSEENGVGVKRGTGPRSLAATSRRESSGENDSRKSDGRSSSDEGGRETTEGLDVGVNNCVDRHADAGHGQGEGRKANREREAETATDDGCGAVRSFFVDVFDCSLCREYGLLMFCFCSVFCRYNLCVFLQHMPRKAAKVGITKEETAALMSAFGIVVICGRIVMTVVANLEWVSRVALYGSGVAVGAVGSYLTMIHSVSGFFAASIFHGMHLAMTNTIAFVVLVDMLGINKLPKAMALFNLIVAIGGMTAAPASGLIYDVTGDYDIPFILSGTLALMASVFIIVPVIVSKISGQHGTCNRKSETRSKQ